MSKAHSRLREHLHTTQLLGSIQSSLYYDQNTAMPSGGASWRGEQLALLAKLLHGRQSSSAYAELVAEAEADLSGDAPPQTRRNLQLLRQELQRQQCLDPALVGELATAQAEGYAVWQRARAQADFSLFAPVLERLVALRQQQAAQLAPVEAAAGQARSAWETLAQRFEPDISKQRLAVLFAPLSQRLPELLDRASSIPPGASQAWDLAHESQEQLCSELLDGWGYNRERCARALSPHPFSTTLGPSDFRITTRVVPGQPFSAFLATAHEWGHSRYEQGLPRSGEHWFPWPLGEATSMAVHESQSLFHENRLARSAAFAERWYPRFRQALGRDPWGGALGFWRNLNPVRPSLIRVEADEVSYGLHIVLRYELEIALLEGDLPVAELPSQWNRRLRELMGITPAHDGEGCLQDVHWSEGLFGYFPSYALGHLISAQLSGAMEADLGPIEARLANGDDQMLVNWLAERVFPLGRSVNAEQLVELVTGSALTAEPFLTYLEQKLDRLIG